MKKVMICSIVLLPIIILLILSVSGVIVSSSSYLYVESIEFVEDEITLVKDTLDPVEGSVKVNIFPKFANNQGINYWSANEDIVSVDAEGNLKGYSFGETYVFASSKENETKKATCKVIITTTTVHTISILNPIDTMYLNESYRFNVSIYPEDADNPRLIWESSDPSILSITDDGQAITYSKKGTVKLSVKSEANNNAFQEMLIIVKEKIDGLTIEDSSPVLTGGNTYVFPPITVHPSTETAGISYSSSNEQIATVDNDGVVTFHKRGTVTIIATEKGGASVSKVITSTNGYIEDVVYKDNIINLQYEESKEINLNYLATPSEYERQYISFSSSDSSVVQIIDKKAYIKGGGTCYITCKYYITASSYKTVKCTVNIQRDTERIDFTNDNNEVTKIIYTKKIVNEIKAKPFPGENNDKITNYSLSDDSVASISNGVLTFKNVEYAKVNVKATTESGIESVATYIYISESLKPFLVDKGDTTKSFILPLSSYEQKVVFTPYIHGSEIEEVEVSSSNTLISLNNEICTATNSGDATITITVNKEVYATIAVKIIRKVEEIKNIKLTSEIDGVERNLDIVDGYAYTSASLINLSYDLFPSDTYVNKVTIAINSSAAQEENGNIKFSYPGKVLVTLTADNAIQKFYIESTNGLFDMSSTLISSSTIEKGEELSANDLFSYISPSYASLSYVTFASNDESVIIVENNKIKAIKGGDAVLTVKYKTIISEVTKDIHIHVLEKVESIKADNYYYVTSASIKLDNYYCSYPTSSNYENGVEYILVEGNAISAITNGNLVFTDAGLARVKVKTENNVEKVLSFIFVDEIDVIEGLENTIDIEINKKFIIKPTKAVLDTATYLDSFIASKDLQVTNGAVLTINKETLDKQYNAVCEFAGNEYLFRGIIKSTSIVLSPLNSHDVDAVSSSSYVTALNEIPLKNTITPINATNDEYSYSVSDTSIAEVVDGKLIFKTAGEITVTSTNKDGNSSSIKVNSTFGSIETVNVTSNNIVKQFDNENALNNVFDLSSLIIPYPSQAIVSKDNVKLLINNDVATINDLTITLNRGGNARIDVKINGNDHVVATINLKVERKATSIILNGEDINSITSKIEIHSSLQPINTKFYSVDANVNNDITFEIVSGNSYAYFNGKLLMFTEVNQDVGVKFTLGGEKEWTIIFRTDSLTRNINIDEEVIIAPAKETFTFYSDNGATFTVDTISFAIDKKGTYDYYSSIAAIGTIGLTINDIKVVKTFIITDRVYDITGVEIEDINNNIVEKISVSEGYLHSTASKEIKVSYDPISYSLNRFGNIETVEIISSNTAIADVLNNKVLFKKPGKVNITLQVNGSDYYGEYSVNYNFDIYSSFNLADDFEINNIYSSGIIIDSINNFDIKPLINNTFPKYGTINAKYSYSTTNNSIATVSENGMVNILSTGLVSINVSTIGGNNTQVIKSISINIDKYIDSIKFTKESNIICQDVTKSNTYKLNLEFLSNTSVKPTLLDVTYSIVSGNATVSNNGIVSFGLDDTRVAVKVEANNGDAESTLVISKVPSDVNIIVVDNLTDTIESKINSKSVINPQFGETYVEYSMVGFAEIDVVSSSTNSFSGNSSAEINLLLINTSKTIKLVITQDVESVKLKLDAKEDNYLTALGENGLDLNDLYGPYIVPSTARNINGLEKISYEIKNITGGASVNSEGILTFTKAGIVEITFKAGDKFIKRNIESTMGYAKSVSFNSDIQTYFEYSNGSYSVDYSKLIVVPSDATKKNYSLSSSNLDVFETSGNVIKFNGVGNANLILSYSISATINATTSQAIFVNNRATQIDAYDGDDLVGYIIKNNNFTLSTKVSYLGSKLTDYSLSYESLDTSIATVASNGLVSFVKNDKPVTIRVKVINSYDSVVDCYKDVIVVCTNKNIVKVKTNSSVTLEYGSAQNTIIYPVPLNGNASFTYEIIEGSEYVSLSQGTITAIEGGYSIIKVKDSGTYEILLNVFVHRSAESIDIGNANLNSNFITAKATHAINPSIMPVSARYEKTFDYEYDETIASINNDTITFIKAGTLHVKIKVMYKESVECIKTINIQYTAGEVISFDVKQNGNTLSSNYEISNVGEHIEFTISNIIPSDYVGDYQATTNNSSILTVSKNNNIVKVLAKSKGQGVVTFGIGDVKYYTTINVLLKATNIDVKYGGKSINSISTIDDTFTVSSQVYPLDASNLGYQYSISGGASVSANGTVSLSGCSLGNYTLTISSLDGGATKDILIQYVGDITDFTVLNNDSEMALNDTIRLNWNVEDVVITIKSSPDTIGVDYSIFNISSLHGSTINRNGNVITIKTLSTSTTPNFSDVITISYKSLPSFTFNIYRYGVKSVNFGNLDNQLDTSYGLQQMRLFGNTSYYNGKTENYYSMPLKVEPASLYNIVTWKSSQSSVSVTAGDGFANVYLNNVTGSSREDISNDIFSNGEVVVSACDDLGNILYSYTFHVVSAVNVFDVAGYMNAGKYIVLHTNFGHDDEVNSGKQNCVKLENYAAKTVVYGNGYLINFAYRNEQPSDASYDGADFVSITIDYAYNINMKGTNTSVTDENRHCEMVDPKEVKYCELTYMYRGVEALKGPSIKRCLFRSITFESIYLNYYVQNVYVEDLVIFDGGATAIELERKDLYIKGFLDIYNYQNKDKIINILDDFEWASSLSFVANMLIKGIERDNKDYASEKKDGKYYTNICIVSTQSESPSQLYYYNSTTGEYEYRDDGNESSAQGLHKINASSLLSTIGYSIYIWSLPDIDGYPRWADQYYDDGTVNYSKLASTEVKLLRLN